MNVSRNFSRLKPKFRQESNKTKMTIDKSFRQQPKIQKANDNPLSDIAGKFGGEFWLKTQSEIEISRQKDKKETKQLQDNNSNQQD